MSFILNLIIIIEKILNILKILLAVEMNFTLITTVRSC